MGNLRNTYSYFCCFEMYEHNCLVLVDSVFTGDYCNCILYCSYICGLFAKEVGSGKMNKYQKALSTINDTLIYYMVNKDILPLPSDNEIHDAMAVLRKIVDKADSFEWIPVTERLPEEHESAFAKVYGTDQWNNALWRTRSNEVLVSIEYDDGNRTVTTSFTLEGKWRIERRRVLHDFKVIAWMPLPKPMKEK